jgi:dynein heavy chain 1
LNPEAYITATRQCIAQANNWSLEELVLDVTITDSNSSEKTHLDDCSFGVTGTCCCGTFFDATIVKFCARTYVKLHCS